MAVVTPEQDALATANAIKESVRGPQAINSSDAYIALSNIHIALALHRIAAALEAGNQGR